MLGRPARTVVSASLTISRELRKGATPWPSIRLPPARRHRSPERSARQPSRRAQLRISADHGENRIQLQSIGAGIDLVGKGPLPVHRSNLARHHETGWCGAGTRPLRRCHYPHIEWALRRFGSSNADCNPAASQRSESQRDAGWSADSQQRGIGELEHRPSADQWRALHCAFSRRRWRRKAYQRRIKTSAQECGGHVSACCRCQPHDFL